MCEQVRERERYFRAAKLVSDHQAMPATRLYVSGNRSQVGKSSVCLGLIGSLLKSGFSASEVSYIKPATQCTKKTLVAAFCEQNGIKCQYIGPIVYYSGFTRKFLDGETDSSAEMIEQVRKAVDDVAQGVKVCIIDGVGYPAVGSICGVDNASLAQALGASVILVGKVGVGDAIDSFNLDSNWFLSRGVPVLGAIYNRYVHDLKGVRRPTTNDIADIVLAAIFCDNIFRFLTTGYYSLDKCRKYLEKYFELRRSEGATQKIYGFVPELSATVTAEAKPPQSVATGINQNDKARDNGAFVANLIAHVHEHIDVVALVKDAAAAQTRGVEVGRVMNYRVTPPRTVESTTIGTTNDSSNATTTEHVPTIALSTPSENNKTDSSEEVAKKPRLEFNFDFSSFDDSATSA